MRRGGGSVLLLGALLGAALGARWAGGTSVQLAAEIRSGGPVAPEDVLLLGTTAVVAVLLGWLVLAVVVDLAARAPGAGGRLARRTADRVTPVAVRRLTVALLGAAVATTATSAAHADDATPAPTWTSSTSPLSVGRAPDPGFAPTPPAPAPSAATTAAAPSASPRADRPPPTPRRTSTPAPAATRVVVTRGDSLWAIAARHLGPGATDRQIAAEWPRWYAANRSVIGPDPDLIRVGQVLVAPGAHS